MARKHRTVLLFGWMMLGALACAGDAKTTDSAGTAVPHPATVAGATPATGAAAAAGSTSGSGAGAPTPTVPAGTSAATGTPTVPAATSGATEPPKATAGASAATGMFTAAQATHGRDVYANACARCHMTTQHSGATFASTWNNRRVFDLYDILYNTMPLDDPGSLTDQEYVDVVAYILQLNGHSAGKTKLPADPAALKALRIDIRTSAGP